MFYNGEWKKLGEVNGKRQLYQRHLCQSNKMYSVAEKDFRNGAYPVRIYGTEKKSGVKGNTIYSAIMCGRKQ